MAKISLITLVIAAVSSVNLAAFLPTVPNYEWADYKATYNKVYNNKLKESFARFNYACNKHMIQIHNTFYISGGLTYSLAINQFSDLSFIEFAVLFQPAISLAESNEKPAPAVQPAAPFYDPSEMGFKSNIENQGTKCSSGWAYAAAKSMELFKAYSVGDMKPLSLSAQNLIDCAGSSAGCRNQIPQAAFDYLTQHNMSLHLESDYKNKNNKNIPGMCTPPTNAKKVVNLSAYSKIKSGDDESLKSYVSAGIPVVVEFNPGSFFFMHYSKGIFRQPIWKFKSSHFMVVIGYGTDNATNKDYWLLQNSFGTTWGTKGLMQLERTSAFKISENAIFPSELL